MTQNLHPQAGAFAPYADVPIGFEKTYTGQTDLAILDSSDPYLAYSADTNGNVMMQYSLWGFTYTTEDQWTDEIRAINRMQADLGPLDDATRAIRAHIASLVPCDNGFPVTVDEILNAIGTGQLPQPAFHPGCWMSSGTRGTQPGQVESMRVIETVLQSYLDGVAADTSYAQYPYAGGFIRRAYDWLGPVDVLTDVQKLLIKRMLLPFEFFAKHSDDRKAVFHTCFDEGEAGKQLDVQIAALADLPPIYPNYRREYKENLAAIADPKKQALYTIAGHIADCVSELSDCHHSTFRRIERWIHGIGTLAWDMPTRQHHAEGLRLGRALFGYALGLDRWLQGVPMQFLLLDLGHVDLGFDPKNEILRVYAYLGEDHTPVRQWLAACLWFNLTLMPPASLYQWGWRHKELLAHAAEQGINVREWVDKQLTAMSARLP
ncbi:MAG: hypothetical protein ACK2UQ_08885 [Anaerolineae bacterium]